ncbi:MAG: hypothetical protein CMA12_04990 [Euryarchaeota archaeon]|nr:hypothetical protein [Euryarchaeota archaeon]OUW22192.1 MAG: hypothetical protein CBD33_02855 [Euryarchaeota archaeon TMED173]
MTQEAENWWQVTPEDTNQGDPVSPLSIQITGHEVSAEPRKHEVEQQGGAVSESGPIEWSSYSKQKAQAIGIFLFAFLVGDWWWDGSNGFAAMFWSIHAILEWPNTYIWLGEMSLMTPEPINSPLLMLSWALWDVTPLIFFASFLYGSNLLESRNLKEDSFEIRQRGKKAHRNLRYFVLALILMDLLIFTISGNYPIWEYPLRFFEMRPGIYWMLIAFGASYGLNPRIKMQSNE